MGKKIIKLTESDLTKIVQKVISEQSEERSFVRAIQRFLNDKKITGEERKPLVVDGKTDNNLNSQTSQAISKYQQMIRVSPADGVWGELTWAAMPSNDKKKLNDLIADEGGLIDKFLHWIGVF